MPQFSVIIVSYESSDWIGACLEGLENQTFQDFETIIVDNHSSDQSADIVEHASLKNKHLIRSQENLGFAKGSNLGAANATGDWLVFLNPDTVAHCDWLDEIAAGQARHPGISAFACTQYKLGSEAHLDGTGDSYFGFGIPWRGGFGHPASDLPREGECFSPCGAAAVLRRDIFEQLNGFDERYFCYCEDIDLGFRHRLLGERCVFLPLAAVNHKGSAITKRHSPFSVYYGTRNRIWTYVKNMPIGMLLLTAPGHIALNIAALLQAALSGRFLPTARGIYSGVKGIPAIWSTRQKSPKASARFALYRAMSWNVIDMLRRNPCVKEF